MTEKKLNARESIVESGFLAARASCKVIEEMGLTEKARLIAHRLDDLALQLLKLAQQIDQT